MTLVELAYKLRPIIEQAVESLDDSTALEAVTLYPGWHDLAEQGRTAPKGFRFRHEGKLYRTEQPSYTFVDTYVPGTTGTESLFSRVDERHAGTYEDPIPYEKNMEVYQGSYYTESGVLYLCIRSSGQPLHHDLKDLVGSYVEVV